MTFQEELDFGGGQPHKTHEEAWFFHQLRHMLVMEAEDDLFLARGTPRAWLEHGKKIGVTKAPSYFGELSYRIESFVNTGRIEVTLRATPPSAPSEPIPASTAPHARSVEAYRYKRAQLGGI